MSDYHEGLEEGINIGKAEAAARIAELEEELSIWQSVFPDIAPERVLPDRRLLLNRIAELEAALQDMSKHVWRGDWDKLKPETRALLGETK